MHWLGGECSIRRASSVHAVTMLVIVILMHTGHQHRGQAVQHINCHLSLSPAELQLFLVCAETWIQLSEHSQLSHSRFPSKPLLYHTLWNCGTTLPPHILGHFWPCHHSELHSATCRNHMPCNDNLLDVRILLHITISWPAHRCHCDCSSCMCRCPSCGGHHCCHSDSSGSGLQKAIKVQVCASTTPQLTLHGCQLLATAHLLGALW